MSNITNIRTLRIADDVTAFGEAIPVGTQILNEDNDTWYFFSAIAADTDTLTTATVVEIGGGGTMVYPGVGIALSTGSAWDTSITDNSSNWNTAYGWGDHSAEGYLTSVEMDYIGTPTDTELQDWSNAVQSAGVIDGGTITAGTTTGSIDIATVRGIVKTTNSAIGANVFFELSGTTNEVLTDNDVNYVAIDYNSGTPQFVIGTSNVANGHTIFNLGKVYREGSGCDIINSGLNIYDFSKRVQQHHVESATLKIVSGAVVSEVGTRNIAITAGIMYAGINRIITDAINTSTGDDFEYYYYNGSSWVESDETQIDNANYNNITSGLVSLTSNKYTTAWIYKGTGSSTYVIYGRLNSSLTDAQTEQPYGNLPEHVSEFGALRAKIIIQEGETGFIEIELVNDINFVASSASNHNELSGLQGGTADQYYHMTSTDYSSIANWNTAYSWGDWSGEDFTAVTAAKISNWDTAYGWGDHSTAGYLTSETSHADVVVDGDFTSNGILKRTASGVYGIVTDNSSNWDTAYGWGDHSGLYELTLGNPTSDGDVLSSTIAGVRSWITPGSGGVTDHGALTGLGDDDHTQYHNDTRAATWLSAGHETTYDHSHYNTAYSWGDHASAGYEDALGNPTVNGYVLSSTTAGVRSWIAQDGEDSKAFTVFEPVATDDIAIMYTHDALTFTRVSVVSTGTSPSVTWDIKYAADRSAAGTSLKGSTQASTSTTTGDHYTTLTNDEVPADNYIWIEISAVSGTITETNFTLQYELT